MLIGCFKWEVTLSRFDVQYDNNKLAQFIQNSRKRHSKRALKLFGYLKHYTREKMYFDPKPIFYNGI